MGVIVGVATVGKLTVKLNVVVFVTPPPDALTVMVELPAGVEPLVLIVNVEEQLGLQLDEEKEAVAPVGSPETENESASVLPDTSVALMALVTKEPASTDLSPECESEKSNGWVRLKEALVSALELYPLLKAFALTTVLCAIVMAPLYRDEAWVGVEPSVV